MKLGQSSQLISLLLLLLMIVGGVFFVLPLRTQVSELSTERDALGQTLMTAQEEYQALAALADEVSKSETAKGALIRSVPVGYSEDQLLLDLDEMASEAGFSLSAINFSDMIKPDLGKTIVVTTNLTGAYDNLVDFLQKLESADRLLQVTSLNVQRTSTTAIAFNLQIEAYYQ